MQMQTPKPEPKFLSTSDLRPFIYKIFYPGIFVMTGILVLGATGKPAGAMLGAVLILGGVTEFLIVGLVKADEEVLLYKTFVEWHAIDYKQFAKCGRSFLVGLHYLKLRRFVPPFGKLYFVHYSPTEHVWERPALDAETIGYLRARINGETPTELITDRGRARTQSSNSRANDVGRCAISATVAILMILVLRFVGWPGPSFHPKAAPSQDLFYRLNVYWWQFCGHLVSWPYNIAAVTCILICVGILRFRGLSITLSAVLGAILGGMAARLFHF